MAARYLAAAGWTYDELGMVFSAGAEALKNHLNGECRHMWVDRPVEISDPAAAEIRALRKSADMTQSELAEAAGVSPSTVLRWEHGRNDVGEYEVKKVREVVD